MDKTLLTLYLIFLLTPTIMAILYKRKDWLMFLLVSFFNIYLAPLLVWVIIKKEKFIS